MKHQGKHKNTSYVFLFLLHCECTKVPTSHLEIVLQDIKLACKHIQYCSSTNKVDNNIDQGTNCPTW